MATTVTDKECVEYARSVSVSPACLPIKPSKISFTPLRLSTLNE
jgi:hypothetical protein